MKSVVRIVYCSKWQVSIFSLLWLITSNAGDAYILSPASFTNGLDHPPLQRGPPRFRIADSANGLPRYSSRDAVQEVVYPNVRFEHYHGEQNPQSMLPQYFVYNKQDDIVETCDGRKNLIYDMNVFALILGSFSTFVGFGLDMMLWVKAIIVAAIGVVLGIILAIPPALISIINRVDLFQYFLSNGANFMSFAVTLFGWNGFDIGNLGLFTDVLFTILGVTATIISIPGTFPEWMDGFIEFANEWGFGQSVNNFIQNYRC